MRLIDARLQLVSSRNMNSEHGFEALIRPEFGTVCHLLIVVSNCIPGSAQRHAAFATWPMMSRARAVFAGFPVVRHFIVQGWSFSTACMKSSVARTELFEFWPLTVR